MTDTFDERCSLCREKMDIEHHRHPLYGAEPPFDDPHARYVCWNRDCDACPLDEDEDGDFL